jgi:hypothetical protein
MAIQDVFVGTVSVGVGLSALLSAVFNWDWSYRFWMARWVESRFGRRGARIFYTILGALMVALGVAIALGFGPNKSPERQASRFSILQDTHPGCPLPG